MKNLKNKIILILITLTILLSIPIFVSAQSSVDVLFQQYTYKGENTESMSQTNIQAVNKLANKKSWTTILSGIIKVLLNISGGLALLSFTAGGVMFISARGSSDLIDKAKKLLFYSLIGLIIIAAAYGLVYGVANLQFFTAGTGQTNTTGNSSTEAPAQSSAAPAAPAAPATNATPGKYSGASDGGGTQNMNRN